MKPLALSVVGICVFAALSCGDGNSGPARVPTWRYDISLISGAPLPYLTHNERLSQAKIVVISGALIPESSSKLADVVRYQKTSADGATQTTYDETVILPYVLTSSELTLTRTNSDGTTRQEVWTITDGGLEGARMYRNLTGALIGPTSTTYSLFSKSQ